MEKGRLAMSTPADVLKARNEYSGRYAEGSQQRANPDDNLSPPFMEFDLRTSPIRVQDSLREFNTSVSHSSCANNTYHACCMMHCVLFTELFLS
jgi:hypothetical protein